MAVISALTRLAESYVPTIAAMMPLAPAPTAEPHVPPAASPAPVYTVQATKPTAPPRRSAEDKPSAPAPAPAARPSPPATRPIERAPVAAPAKKARNSSARAPAPPRPNPTSDVAKAQSPVAKRGPSTSPDRTEDKAVPPSDPARFKQQKRQHKATAIVVRKRDALAPPQPPPTGNAGKATATGVTGQIAAEAAPGADRQRSPVPTPSAALGPQPTPDPGEAPAGESEVWSKPAQPRRTAAPVPAVVVPAHKVNANVYNLLATDDDDPEPEAPVASVALVEEAPPKPSEPPLSLTPDDESEDKSVASEEEKEHEEPEGSEASEGEYEEPDLPGSRGLYSAWESVSVGAIATVEECQDSNGFYMFTDAPDPPETPATSFSAEQLSARQPSPTSETLRDQLSAHGKTLSWETSIRAAASATFHEWTESHASLRVPPRKPYYPGQELVLQLMREHGQPLPPPSPPWPEQPSQSDLNQEFGTVAALADEVVEMACLWDYANGLVESKETKTTVGHTLQFQALVGAKDWILSVPVLTSLGYDFYFTLRGGRGRSWMRTPHGNKIRVRCQIGTDFYFLHMAFPTKGFASMFDASRPPPIPKVSRQVTVLLDTCASRNICGNGWEDFLVPGVGPGRLCRCPDGREMAPAGYGTLTIYSLPTDLINVNGKCRVLEPAGGWALNLTDHPESPPKRRSRS